MGRCGASENHAGDVVEPKALAHLVEFLSRLYHFSPGQKRCGVGVDGYDQEKHSRRQARHPDASLGLGLCQEPSEAMIESDSFGPQLWRL
jgi:hypothetical protein